MNVNCAKGCLDKTPKFMEERQKIIILIDSVYKKHNVEKLETPVFELKELYSNNINKFDKIYELNDQGGALLAMRYDLKTSLTRYLAMNNIVKHTRISQFGNVYRKEPVIYDQLRLREFFVSDFDISGPSDPMLSEVQCLRVACDIVKALSINEPYTLKIGHRKLTECCLRHVMNIGDSEAVCLISKLANDNKRSCIDWDSVVNKKITPAVLANFKAITETYSGDLTTMLESMKSNESLNALKEFKSVIEKMVLLDGYCKLLLSEENYKKIRLDLSLIGPRSYYTGMTFAVYLNDADKNFLSGGHYDMIVKINSKSKFSAYCTGFTLGIDQFVFHRLLKEGAVDLLLTPNNKAIGGLVEPRDLSSTLDKLAIQSAEDMTSDDKNYALRNVKGTIDRDSQRMIIQEKVFHTIVECFQRHKAVTIDTPVMERKDVLMNKYGEDSKLIYDLNDVDGEQLSLRYDLTVPFARYLAMNPDVIGNNKVFKRYQIGKVYRRDNPSISTGRYREFYQCDFDSAGADQTGLTKMAPDAECLTIVYEVLRDLNLGDYMIKVSHRRFLDGLFEVCDVPASMFRTICSSVDKLDKTPWSIVKDEMIQKGLSEVSADRIGEYVKQSGNVNLIDSLEKDDVLFANKNVREALAEMRQLFDLCSAIMNKVSFDLSLARGLDYYTGMIFEAVFTKTEAQDTADQSTGDIFSQESVGSVSAGGRYDKLVNMFLSSDVTIPCVGFSFGVERLIATYHRRQSSRVVAQICPDRKPVVVMTAQKNMVDERLKLLSMLLDNGITAVHSLKKNPPALDVFQECDRLGIPWAVIIGEDELVADSVKLRHIETRAEEMVPRADIVARLSAL